MNRPKLSRNGKLIFAVVGVLVLLWAGRKYQERKLYQVDPDRSPETPGVKTYLVKP